MPSAAAVESSTTTPGGRAGAGFSGAAPVARAAATRRKTPGLRRKRDDKRRTLPRRRAPDLDPATMEFLDDALDQGEAQSPAARPGRVPGLERAGDLLGRHAAAVVGDGELDRLGLGTALEADLDPPALLVDGI